MSTYPYVVFGVSGRTAPLPPMRYCMRGNPCALSFAMPPKASHGLSAAQRSPWPT